MLLTVVDSRPLGVAVFLPAMGSWWDFEGCVFRLGPSSSSGLLALRRMPLAVPPYDLVQWACLPDGACLPDAVPFVSVLDASGAAAELLDWLTLTFTLGSASGRSFPVSHGGGY